MCLSTVNRGDRTHAVPSVQFRAAEKQKERDLNCVRFYKQATPTGFEDGRNSLNENGEELKQAPVQFSQNNLPVWRLNLDLGLGGQISRRVRQEGHYHASRCSNSPCGGRSKGSLPNSRAMRVKKSGGKRSGRTAPFWVSTSSKASHTSFSSEDAALASSVFSFASNSSAMADMALGYSAEVSLARMTSGRSKPIIRPDERINLMKTNQTKPVQTSMFNVRCPLAIYRSWM